MGELWSQKSQQSGQLRNIFNDEMLSYIPNFNIVNCQFRKSKIFPQLFLIKILRGVFDPLNVRGRERVKQIIFRGVMLL